MIKVTWKLKCLESFWINRLFSFTFQTRWQIKVFIKQEQFIELTLFIIWLTKLRTKENYAYLSKIKNRFKFYSKLYRKYENVRYIFLKKCLVISHMFKNVKTYIMQKTIITIYYARLVSKKYKKKENVNREGRAFCFCMWNKMVNGTWREIFPKIFSI